MSDPHATSEGGAFARLPRWARPGESERRGTGRLRLAEMVILILVGLFLAIATVNDVVRQTHVNHRLIADLRTWRTVSGRDYPSKTIAIEGDIKNYTTEDIVCGNTSPGELKEHTQLCLTLVGPVVRGLREISGGYYLPPGQRVVSDGFYFPPEVLNRSSNRFACFGTALAEKLCGLRSPPAGSPPTPPVRTGLP